MTTVIKVQFKNDEKYNFCISNTESIFKALVLLYKSLGKNNMVVFLIGEPHHITVGSKDTVNSLKIKELTTIMAIELL